MISGKLKVLDIDLDCFKSGDTPAHNRGSAFFRSSSQFFFIFFVSGLSLGCSMDASIQSLSNSIIEIFSKPTLTEVTPASNQNAYSTRGYSVQASVSYQDSVVESTTPRGFKAYTSVQGTILKE